MLEELENTILHEGLNQLGYIFRSRHSDDTIKAWKFVKYYPEEEQIFIIYELASKKFHVSKTLDIPEEKPYVLERNKSWVQKFDERKEN